MTRRPRLDITGPANGGRAVVIVLPGGSVSSVAPARRGLAYARMLPVAAAIAHAVRDKDDTAVWLVRYRVRGWNEPAPHGNEAIPDPVRDGRWAVAEARRRHPDARIVLIGHSMGGRVGLRLSDEPGVAGVCALAPWIEQDEPARTTRAASVLVAHGDCDRVTDPAASSAYAARTGATFVAVPGEGHTLLRRPIFWQRLVTGFVATLLEAVPEP